MSGAGEGWIALEDASGAFERPVWAVRALVDQGKIESKVEGGVVWVRAPGPPAAARPLPAGTPASDAADLAKELAVFLDEPTASPADEGDPARAAPTALTLPGPFAAAVPPAPGSLSWPDARRWEALTADLEALVRANQARDALLARAARALASVEARERRLLLADGGGHGAAVIVRRPRRRVLRAPALLLAALALAGGAVAFLGLDEASIERTRAAIAERRAERLARELEAERSAASRDVGALASSATALLGPAPGAPAPLPLPTVGLAPAPMTLMTQGAIAQPGSGASSLPASLGSGVVTLPAGLAR